MTDGRRFTHVRLSIYPDGGVARFRVHGEPVPDPALPGRSTFDLAALENGGDVIECSDSVLLLAGNILMPGRARTMGEGWENARRRDGGNDHVSIRLGAARPGPPGRGRHVLLRRQRAGWARCRGADARSQDLSRPGDWVELVPRTRLQPDTRHLFRVTEAATVTHVRLDVFPDGGLARLRVHGAVPPPERAAAVGRWLDLLPEPHAVQVLATDGGLSPDEAAATAASRPLGGTGRLPEEVVRRLLG